MVGLQAISWLEGRPYEAHTTSGNPIDLFFLIPVALVHAIAPPSFLLLKALPAAVNLIALPVGFWFARRLYGERPGSSGCPSGDGRALNVEFDRFFGPFHDEAEAGGRVLAHQFVDHAIGDDLIGDLDPEQPPRPRIHRRFPEDLGHHLAEKRR